MESPSFESHPSSTFSFTRMNKARFYWHYLINKTFRIWWEVKTPKFKLFAYEIVYSLAMALRRPLPTKPFSNITFVNNFRGQYLVRPRTHDIAIASPAFERDDMDHLLGGIRELIGRFESVIFMDVGADFGTYCITVGNSIAENGLQIIAYEPTSSSFELLSANVNLNNLDRRIKLRDTALGNSPESECQMATYLEETGNSSLEYSSVRPYHIETVKLTTLDSESHLIEDQSRGHAIVLKIDCEGAERDNWLAAADCSQIHPKLCFL